ncbi:pyrroline-5-carboxylate reductase dimerization-domain-containing protein [Aspergillus venezuelensis]
MSHGTLCILGCGNLGTAILKSLLASENQLFTKYIACVSSNSSTERLKTQFTSSLDKNIFISTGDNVSAIKNADVVILGLDPSVISSGLSQDGIADALGEKLLISVAAGWTVEKLYETLYGTALSQKEKAGKASIIRTLPTITALVGQSLTAIEINPVSPPNAAHLDLTDAIFTSIGKTQHIPPSLIDATTAVAGSTPAMFAIIVDAMVDAAVAVGVPRPLAQGMVLQSMSGSAAIMQAGTSPAELRDQGTSPEGCTIGGVMVLEERGVRGGIQRAVREAVTLARRMDGVGHFNDTRP